MGDIWFTSDQHFGDNELATKYTCDDGKQVRGFPTVEAMNEFMIQQWNSVVKPQDKVYCGGDFSMVYGKVLDVIASRLQGKKRLILGNHDEIKGTNLGDWFKKVSLWRIFKEEGFVITHIPMHPSNFHKKVVANVHGHIHQNQMKEPYYLNICVENWNYRPVHMDEIKQIIKDRGLEKIERKEYEACKAAREMVKDDVRASIRRVL